MYMTIMAMLFKIFRQSKWILHIKTLDTMPNTEKSSDLLKEMMDIIILNPIIQPFLHGVIIPPLIALNQ